ncbi:HD domain-containing protein [Caldalkalibacillus salinus]|uniref:HD domain-containing protein n=1 Tax=Caldalkalibacillus salinus TaxID=2803787 RepID=UPI0019241191|nr:HD domain-containing protein [Caldalkalibacillus salinus]
MQRHVTLLALYNHPITRKYVSRSGMAHAISVAYHAYHLAIEKGIDPDLATKAGFLHDIGHYTWYKVDGDWDYHAYQNHDIHPIKGAERAHKLLIRLGEDRQKAKEVSLAILLHTDSILPEGQFNYTPLQSIVHMADEKDKEPHHLHHYRQIEAHKERQLISRLDEWVGAKMTVNTVGRLSSV